MDAKRIVDRVIGISVVDAIDDTVQDNTDDIISAVKIVISNAVLDAVWDEVDDVVETAAVIDTIGNAIWKATESLWTSNE